MVDNEIYWRDPMSRRCARDGCGHYLAQHAFPPHSKHDQHRCLKCIDTPCDAFVDPGTPAPIAIENVDTREFRESAADAPQGQTAAAQAVTKDHEAK